MKPSGVKVFLLIIISIFSFNMCTQNANWRGENRDGHFQEYDLLKQWPENGPDRILKVEGIGLGHSSAIMANNTIYTTGMIDTMDYLSSIDFNGTIQW